MSYKVKSITYIKVVFGIDQSQVNSITSLKNERVPIPQKNLILK